MALAIGFPLAIAATYVATLLFRATGVTPDDFTSAEHQVAAVISRPDFFTFFIAACAGAAGMLSLTTAKSGALIGVLISVTTIPAAANIGVAAAYGDWAGSRGAFLQLAINLGTLLAVGSAVLVVQRSLFLRRRRDHLAELARRGVGRFRRATPSTRDPA